MMLSLAGELGFWGKAGGYWATYRQRSEDLGRKYFNETPL